MTPRLKHACDIVVELSTPHEMGICLSGARRIIPIVGGTVSGPLITGRILGVGADWQTVLSGGVADLDARYAIETEDGAVIEVISQGIRHMSPEIAARIGAGEAVPSNEYYMRTSIRLETGHAEYNWVNRTLFVASGAKTGSNVQLSVYLVA